MAKSKIINTGEELGFSVKISQEKNRRGEYSYYVIFEQETPCGEDWRIEFVVSAIKDIPAEIQRYADDYDADEEAELWIEHRGERGVPDSIADLISDARWKDEKLTELAWALNNSKRKYSFIAEAKYLREIAEQMERYNNQDGEKIDLSTIIRVIRETADEAEREA